MMIMVITIITVRAVALGDIIVVRKIIMMTMTMITVPAQASMVAKAAAGTRITEIRAIGKAGVMTAMTIPVMTITMIIAICSIKPCGSGIMLETMRYEDEIKESDPYFGDIDDGSVDKEQLSLAKELIKRKTASFKPEKFHDHYREALQELIDSKLEGRKPRDVVEEPPAGKVINLMDALRKSLKGNDSKPAAKKPAAKSPKKSPRKPPARRREKHGRAA